MKKDKFTLNFVKLLWLKWAVKLIKSAIFNRMCPHFFIFVKNQSIDTKIFLRTFL